MRINKSLITYTPTSGGGSGSVTSVGLTAPSGVFFVLGSPITSSGTLQIGLVNQFANTVWAGPTSGAEDVPDFRALVEADIPNLSASKITSGTLGVARGGTGATTLSGIVIGNGTSAFTGLASTTANQMLRVNSVGTAYEWFTPDYLSNVMTSLGDMIYGNAIGLPVRRSGNTTTTKMYLSQTGDGTNSAAPQWSGIAVGDVSGAVSALTGEVSTTGSGSLNVTLGTTAVTGKLLTGLSITSGSITSSDSILSAFGKVQGQINGLAGGSTYKGSWNANTNTPTIVSGTGTTGDYYIVSTAGTTTIDGVSSWDIGDWIIFSGTVWQKIDNTDSVISVNGQVGSVVLTTANITENTNLYYTDTRARAAISLTTTGASGAATYSSGVLNIPNYTLSGLGGISGSGTPNYLPKFTSATSIGDSIIVDNGGIATIYGAGQVYTQQAGGGIASMFISNNDTTAAINHQTRISTQQLGGGLARTIIQAASYTTDATRGQFGITDETGNSFIMQLGNAVTATDYSMSIYTTAGLEKVRLNTNGNTFLTGGNVGIGTTTPYEKLEVSGAISASGGWSANSSQASVTTMGFQDGYGFVQAVDWGIEYKKLSLNPNGGNVGIGTTSPTGKLQINTSTASNNALTIQANTLTARTYGIGINSSGELNIYDNFSTASRLSIKTDGQLKLSDYTSVASFSGTIAGLLAFDSSGNVITTNLSGVGGVPTSRTITINGTTQDLSANRTFSVGTVTSVALSVPTGLSVAGTPITSSGTLAISLTAGYSIPTTASQTTWDAAYNDKINSASVTGTTTKTLTLNQQDGGTITASWTDINTDAVTSVFGRTGAVVATSGDYTTAQVTEVTNLYYTEARVSANTDVAANTSARHSAVTLGTANGLSLSTQQLSLGLASGSANGALSSTDWTTFNNKQSTLTNPVTGNGAGAIGYFPKFSGVNAIENSNFFESGTALYYGGGSASEYSLQLGHGRSGNGFAYIDLIGDTTYNDYGLRLMRNNGGANTTSVIEHRGTGDFIFKGVDASTIKFQTGSTDRVIVDSAGRVGIGVSPSYTFHVQGTGFFSNNVRLPNLKGVIFEQTGGTTLGSIGMDSSNAITIDNNGFFGLSVGGNYTMIASNLGIGHNLFGTSASRTISVLNGTAPSTSPVDSFQMYSNDITSGNAAPHFRTENGAVIKLYQQDNSVAAANFVAGIGTSVTTLDAFDGYTIGQVVKALRNAGILS